MRSDDELFAPDGLLLTREEAGSLLVYHLATAAMLFEIAPDDGNLSVGVKLREKVANPHVLEACFEFVRKLDAYYASMDLEDREGEVIKFPQGGK
jgi:hypothetical protein